MEEGKENQGVGVQWMQTVPVLWGVRKIRQSGYGMLGDSCGEERCDGA